MSSVRISIDRLKPGMFLVNPGISWLAEPNLYQHEGLISSQDEISAIARQGYAEACYDPIRSQIVRNLESPPVAQTPLAEEIYAAIINQYYDAFEDFKKTMQEKLDQNKQIDLF